MEHDRDQVLAVEPCHVVDESLRTISVAFGIPTSLR